MQCNEHVYVGGCLARKEKASREGHKGRGFSSITALFCLRLHVANMAGAPSKIVPQHTSMAIVTFKHPTQNHTITTSPENRIQKYMNTSWGLQTHTAVTFISDCHRSHFGGVAEQHPFLSVDTVGNVSIHGKTGQRSQHRGGGLPIPAAGKRLAGGGGGWHKALVLVCWRRLLASRHCVWVLSPEDPPSRCAGPPFLFLHGGGSWH